jgi:hypothetical protein
VKEEAVPVAETMVPASVTSAVEQDVMAIARLNAELRTAPHADRPRVKAVRAACLQRIRATMTVLHPEVRAHTLPRHRAHSSPAPRTLRRPVAVQLPCSEFPSDHTWPRPAANIASAAPIYRAPSPAPSAWAPGSPIQPHGRRVCLIRLARSDDKSYSACPLLALLVAILDDPTSALSSQLQNPAPVALRHQLPPTSCGGQTGCHHFNRVQTTPA